MLPEKAPAKTTPSALLLIIILLLGLLEAGADSGHTVPTTKEHGSPVLL
jgi:hypothetical protein